MNACAKNLFTGLMILAGICQVAAQNWQFSLFQSPRVNDDTPISMTAADVNGDGKPDLISGSWDYSTVTVLTNNGNGGFGSNAVYHLYPPDDYSGFYSIAATDVNGDGSPDLIAAMYDDDFSIEILTNNGTGVFSSNAVYGATGGIECVIAADVNENGKSDLIYVDAWNNTVNVLTNNGSGGFDFSDSYPVGLRPISVLAQDVNGDGKLDLITANYAIYPSDPHTLTVLTNSGNGVFGSNATLNVGRHPYWVTAADVNADGWPDLVSANYYDGTLSVLTNNGSGVFGLNATPDVGGGPFFVAPVDVNGDGKIDLVSATDKGWNRPGELTIFTNNGAGVFSIADRPQTGQSPDCLVASDINEDGRPDLVCANYNEYPATLSVFLDLPLPTISPANTNSMSVTWPSLSTGWILQQNADFGTTNWFDSSFTISNDGTNKNITIPSPSGNLFFRLSHP